MGLVSNSIAYHILCQFNSYKLTTCQTTNYLKLQNNCIYALPISRFPLPDILNRGRDGHLFKIFCYAVFVVISLYDL